MNTLPTKKPGDPDVNTIPTWRELAERFRDLVKDFLKEGKELERELEPRLLPALKRLRLEIEKLIAKHENRATKKTGYIRESRYARRSRARSTFPRWVGGSASRKITSRGYLYGSSRPRTKACSSSASPSCRSLATTKACGLTSPCSPTMPTTATSCTAGCCNRQFSTSCGASHLPDTLSRSSARPQ